MAVLVVSVMLTVWSALTLWWIGKPNTIVMGFVSGILCQGLWITFDLMTGAYGLLPLALVYGPLYARGWIKHREAREDRPADAPQSSQDAILAAEAPKAED